MDLSEKVLGKTAATELRTRSATPVLTIGRDAFTRAQLARVSCFNFLAAAHLSKVFREELSVKDTRDVFERIAPDALALPTIGCVSLAVLGAAFEAKRIGGEHPLEAWMMKHRPSPDEQLITFLAVKGRRTRDAEAARGEKRATKRRRRAQQSAAAREAEEKWQG